MLAILEAELDTALGRDRYQRPRLAETALGGRPVVGAGHRHGHRERQLMGTFGPVTVRVPRWYSMSASLNRIAADRAGQLEEALVLMTIQ